MWSHNIETSNDRKINQNDLTPHGLFIMFIDLRRNNGK